MVSKYTLLNDANWLTEKYIHEGLSTNVIARLSGAKTANSVRQFLIKHGIGIRNVSDGLTFKRKNDGFKIENSVLNGCLLGDGGLRVWNRKSDKSYPAFRKRNIYYDHISYVSKLLFNGDVSRVVERSERFQGNKYVLFQLTSLSHKELLPLYRKWYPASRNYIKSVPEDLEIDETVLLHWFLDDGSTTYDKSRKRIRVRLVFCSESFTKEEQEVLSEKINAKFGLGAIVRKTNSGTGWRIEIKRCNVNDFYEVIGKPPVKSLEYKWKTSQ